MSAEAVDCAQCHGAHHQPNATCIACHQESPKAKHDISFAHSQCSMCHGDAVQSITTWSREVCTTCHQAMVEHNAPVECRLCHENVPALDSGG
jgi:hypothetical protein